MQQFGFKCECGYFFNLIDAQSIDHSFAVIRDRDYTKLIQIESAILQHTESDSDPDVLPPTFYDASQLCGSIHICPDCQRLHWKHPDDAEDNQRRIYEFSQSVPNHLTKIPQK